MSDDLNDSNIVELAKDELNKSVIKFNDNIRKTAKLSISIDELNDKINALKNEISKLNVSYRKELLSIKNGGEKTKACKILKNKEIKENQLVSLTNLKTTLDKEYEKSKKILKDVNNKIESRKFEIDSYESQRNILNLKKSILEDFNLTMNMKNDSSEYFNKLKKFS